MKSTHIFAPSARRQRLRWTHLVAFVAVVLPMLAAAQPRRVEPQQWQDIRHGHQRIYPLTGHVTTRLPPRTNLVVRGNSRYWFADGVWYAPSGGRYVVARPPNGLVVTGLPGFATVLTIGAVTYYYANNVYYRPLPAGRFEVVSPPVDAPAAVIAGATAARVFVYPRQGQSAEQQAGDEYECHRWATSQSGFDPTNAATGITQPGTGQREDYQRAAAACLEGRGYTVR